jgi:hypothetical protein
MVPSLLELKFTPSFCFANKISDKVTATNRERQLQNHFSENTAMDHFPSNQEYK